MRSFVGNLLCAVSPVLGLGAAVLCGLTSVPMSLCLGVGVGVGCVAFWEGLERLSA